MTSADVIIDTARSYLGTRFRHQGRTRAEGLDCLGLLLAIANDIGVTWQADISAVHAQCGYSHMPCTTELRRGLELSLIAKHVVAMQISDIVLLCVQGRAQHLGMLARYGESHDFSIIHAYAPARKVVEHRLDDVWRQAIVGVYGLPKHVLKIPFDHAGQ